MHWARVVVPARRPPAARLVYDLRPVHTVWSHDGKPLRGLGWFVAPVSPEPT